MRNLSKNLSDLTAASSQCDILLCTETLVSGLRHVSGSLVSGFGRSVLVYRDMMRRFRVLAAYVRDGYEEFRQPNFACGCCENAGI